MDRKLEEARNHIKQGNKQLGFQLLTKIIQEKPDSKEAEISWMWMSEIISSKAKKITCLEKALQINPQNIKAQKRLTQLQESNTLSEDVQLSREQEIVQEAKSKYSSSLANEGSSEKNIDRTLFFGWVCFGLGILLMLLSLATFIFYAPLFLAAFVLSIIGLAKGKTSGGVLLLLSTLIIPTVCGFTLFSYNIGEAFLGLEEDNNQQLANIVFEEVNARTSSSYMYIEGKVRNNGDTTVDFIKVGVDWHDSNSTILDTDWTYAVGREGLAPGAAKSFEIATPLDSRMTKFRYYILTN